MNLKQLLRTLWRNSPTVLRERALELLCRIKVKPSSASVPPTDTIYVAGFFQAPTGLGASARLYANEAENAGKNVYRIDLTQAFFQTVLPKLERSPLLLPRDIKADDIKGHTLVLHVNPPMFLYALWILRSVLHDVGIIGYWAWELEDIPPVWQRCLKYVHEVQCPSEFTAQAIRRHTNKPVLVHPHMVGALPPSSRAFAEDGTVRVLTIFDIASNFARKNPLATIDAFQQAFGKKSCANLTLKVNNFGLNPKLDALLENKIKGWENITLVTEHYNQQKLRELYHSTDIYISLHRSEGYGLTLREAMSYGLHVIGTQWSGNTDFMYGARCYGVSYTLVPVKDPQQNFTIPEARWADADSTHAAAIFQEICERESFPLT